MTLGREGQSQHVGSRGAALPSRLLEAGGAVVGKDALMQAAWPNTIVEEANLSVQIAALRKVVGQRPDSMSTPTTAPPGLEVAAPAVPPSSMEVAIYSDIFRVDYDGDCRAFYLGEIVPRLDALPLETVVLARQ